MEASSSSSLEHDNEARVLEELLNVFGSHFSLEEIASAFCKAGRDANVAAEILYEFQKSGSHAASAPASNDVLIDESYQPELSGNTAEERTDSSWNYKALKPKRVSVSIGTVSSVLGKDYSKSTMFANGSCETTKPLKLNSDEVPMSELWGKDASLGSTVSKDPLHKDIEDFLYKMLGNGYQLSMDVIQEVLGCCGYDMKKSMEKLIDLSASTLRKSDDIICGSAESSVGDSPKLEYQLCTEKPQHMDIPPSSNRNKTKSLTQDKERYNLQKELLASLFSVPERFEESPRKPRAVEAVKKVRSLRHDVLVSPPGDTTGEFSAEIVETQQDVDHDLEEEDGYHVLRRAAKEHWLTMKEYYKAATDTFIQGKFSLAHKLLEQGQLYNDKAREADQKSSQKILEQSKKENQDQVVLDLHDHDTKEAIRLLKCHLTSFCGIPAFSHLKVIVEADAADTTRGSQKRWVLKLLERESIKWTEEGNGGTVLIRVDEIDPRRLSFAKKNR